MIKIWKRGGSWVYLLKIGDANQRKEEKRRWSFFFVSDVYFERNFENKSKLPCLLTLRPCDFTGFFDSLSSHFFVSVITPFGVGIAGPCVRWWRFELNLWELARKKPLSLNWFWIWFAELHFSDDELGMIFVVNWWVWESLWRWLILIAVVLVCYGVFLDSVVVVRVGYGGDLGRERNSVRLLVVMCHWIIDGDPV